MSPARGWTASPRDGLARAGAPDGQNYRRAIDMLRVRQSNALEGQEGSP